MSHLRCAALAAVAVVVLSSGPASTEPRCDWQNGNTPYCQDVQLAQVARGYGTRITAADIRANPSLKREMCRFIGHDSRIYEACSGWRDDSGGGWGSGSGGAQ